MKSLTLEKRAVFVIDNANESDIRQAKFKLAGLHFGYGKLDKAYYWSLPYDKMNQGYEVLTGLFYNVHRL